MDIWDDVGFSKEVEGSNPTPVLVMGSDGWGGDKGAMGFKWGGEPIGSGRMVAARGDGGWFDSCIMDAQLKAKMDSGASEADSSINQRSSQWSKQFRPDT